MSQTASELYQSTILEHNRRPRGYGELLTATHSAEGFNPICGDRIKIQVVAVDDLVGDLKFTSQCCALCRASASVMVETMIGRPRIFADNLAHQFLAFIQGSSQATSELSASPAAAFFAIKDFPARAKCVLLPWRTLLSSLSDQSVVSTESKE